MRIHTLRKRFVSAWIVLAFVMGGFVGLIVFKDVGNDTSTAENIEYQNSYDHFKDISQEDTRELLAQAPCVFTENRGQLDNDYVRFYVQGGSLWFTDDGAWFDIYDKEGEEEEDIDLFGPMASHLPKSVHREGVILKQEFVDCNPVTPEGVEYAGWDSNFFLGNDPSKWQTEVSNFQEVYYKDLYDGIDLCYYSNEGGLKYDFIVHPGADLDQIKIRYGGADGIELEDSDDLIIKTKIENLKDKDLFIYQDHFGTLQNVDGRFVIFDNQEYGFEISQPYDEQEVLIIDPSIMLEYSTYVGGSVDDYGRDIALDPNGNIYLTGRTSSSDFPTTTGAYDTVLDFDDSYIIKLNSSGSVPVYSTFIGGNSYDYGYAIDINTTGDAYITGKTYSSNFPTTPGAWDTSYNGNYDAFALGLAANGSMLIYSTYLGGNSIDIGNAIAVDTNGDAYITGETGSFNYPTTPGAYDTSKSGSYDVFVSKLNRLGSTLIYSTFIGDSGPEYGNGITFDSSGNAYVTGYTVSPGFPTTSGVYDASFDGSDEVFVTMLNPSGSALSYSTFLGGNNDEEAYGIAVDDSGNAFITGNTDSTNFPTTFGAFDTTHNGGDDVFVTKLNSAGTDALYSTFIGGDFEDIGYGIAIDPTGNAFVTGNTYSIDFPMTPCTYDSTFNGGDYDGFVIRLGQSGSTLEHSTYIGGIRDDYPQGIELDSNNNAYIGGYTHSSDFPTSTNAVQTILNGPMDTFASKFSFHPIMSIESISLLNGNTPADVIYPKLAYTFEVNVTISTSIFDLDMVRLGLDPLGSNIQLQWDRASDQFFEVQDPDNYLTLEPSSEASNDQINHWTIKFDVTFDWTYPDEDVHTVQVYVTSSTLSPEWLNSTDMYHVENDLEFDGELMVKDEEDNELAFKDQVRGGETLTWSGLIPVYQGTTDVYPPKDEYNITVWDESDNSWSESPEPGEPLELETTAPADTNFNGEKFKINITRIPPECDSSYETITLKVDGDNVTFLYPNPDNTTWQITKEVTTEIKIVDTGGGTVDTSSIKNSISKDNGTTWKPWYSVICLDSGKQIVISDDVRFDEGTDNLIKWMAADSLGNGPAESEAYRVIVDTKEVRFSDGWPSNADVSTTNVVSVGITITDATSGVDASTIEYAISDDDGSNWKDWVRVLDFESGGSVSVTQNITFPNGTSNKIKWRTYDIAGNGPTESNAYEVTVNTWLKTQIPRTLLLSPKNGSTIASTSVELSWELENPNQAGVTYDVQVDPIYPPGKTVKPGVTKTSVTVDNLMDGRTYYWRVIPKALAQEGTCLSGIWSFSINLNMPIPTVTLVAPEEGELVNTLRPTLSWSTEYPGTGVVTYNIYLSNSSQPDVVKEGHDSTKFTPDSELENEKTYYWKIEPLVDEIICPSSEILSFSIDTSYVPVIDFTLISSRIDLELKPNEEKTTVAYLTNIGDSADTISLNIDYPHHSGLAVTIKDKNLVVLEPRVTTEFNVLFTATENSSSGEYKVTFSAISGRGLKYGLEIEKNLTVSVTITTVGTGPQDGGSSEDQKGSGALDDNLWLFLLIFIIVIAILVTFMLLIMKRKNDLEKELKAVRLSKLKEAEQKAIVARARTGPQPVVTATERGPPTLKPPTQLLGSPPMAMKPLPSVKITFSEGEEGEATDEKETPPSLDISQVAPGTTPAINNEQLLPPGVPDAELKGEDIKNETEPEFHDSEKP